MISFLTQCHWSALPQPNYYRHYIQPKQEFASTIRDYHSKQPKQQADTHIDVKL